VNTPTLGRLSALITFPVAVIACTCGGIVPIDVAFHGSRFVFTATVVGRVEPARQYTMYEGKRVEVMSGGDMIGWVTVPVQSWKGTLPDTVIVYSARDGAACGYGFQTGRDYIIFADLEDRAGWLRGRAWPEGTIFPVASTYLCGRTSPIQSASAVFTEFAEPTWVRGDPDE